MDCKKVALVFPKDCSDLLVCRTDFVPRHTKLHFPAVYLCAHKLGRALGDHLGLLQVDAEAKVVQCIDQQLSLDYTLLVGPAQQNQIVNIDGYLKAARSEIPDYRCHRLGG